jgi:hypothetical protein
MLAEGYVDKMIVPNYHLHESPGKKVRKIIDNHTTDDNNDNDNNDDEGDVAD